MLSDERDITGGWNYELLPRNIRIGDQCWIERRDSFSRFRSTRDPGLVLGDNVRVYTWTAFNVESTGYIEIGSGSTLVGPIFMCAKEITIGKNVTISYHVTIADSDFHPSEPYLRRQDAIACSPEGDRSRRPEVVAKSVIIDDEAWIGIGAIILKGVHIGRAARVEAGAVVTRNVPALATAAGNPAKVFNA